MLWHCLYICIDLVAKQSHCSWVIWELFRRCLACPLEKLGVTLTFLNVLLFVMILSSLMVSWSWKIVVKNEHHCNSNLNTWQWQFSSTLFLWIKNDLLSLIVDHLVIYIACELFITSPVWEKFQWKMSDLFLLWEVLLICQVILGIFKNKFLGTVRMLKEKALFLNILNPSGFS